MQLGDMAHEPPHLSTTLKFMAFGTHKGVLSALPVAERAALLAAHRATRIADQAEFKKSIFAGDATKLAQWTLATLAVRTDTYGVYYSNGLSCRAKRYGQPLPLTVEVLAKHWRGEQTIGLYTIDPTDFVLCTVLDGDNHLHIAEVKEKNFQAFVRITERLDELRLRYLAYIDEFGGFHVWVPWLEKTPYEIARAFGLWLAGSAAIEVNPKGRPSTTEKQCGNFVRLLLPKPGNTNYARIWTGDCWIERPADQVDFILSLYPWRFERNQPRYLPPESLSLNEAPSLPCSTPSALSPKERLDWARIGQEYTGDLRTLDLVSLFEEQGLLRRKEREGKFIVYCPWYGEHTTGPNAVIWQEEDKYPGFFCPHDHCKGRTLVDVVDYFGAEKVDAHCASSYGGKLDWDHTAIDRMFDAAANVDRLFREIGQ